jgi:hypothetical protein
MPFAFITPLLAANFDWVHAAFLLVVLFVAVMKQLMDSVKEAAKKRERQQQANPRPAQRPQPGAQPVEAAGQQADPLRSQVEEFLRRAGRLPEGSQAQQPPATREIEVIVEEPRPAPRTLGEPLRPVTPQRLTPQQTAADKQRSPRRQKRRQTVAEHVQERVASRSQSLAEKTSQLGQRIITEDQQFDNQLKAKFDHAVGTLAGTTEPTPESVPAADTPARQIAQLLSNPQGVRQAVLLNEILRRPSERW